MKKYTHGIVTGAGKGIGFATVKLLLEKKYSVTAINRSKNKDLENLQKKYKDNLEIIVYDLEKISNIEKLFLKCVKKNHTNFLINNAGIRSRHKINKINLREINKVLNVNFLSVYLMTKAYLKIVKKYKQSHSIVSISSIVGPNRGFDELSLYAASKGALEAGMKSLAIEYAGKNVRINCIAPGFIKTSYYENFKKNKPSLYKWTKSRTPLKRWGKPEEVADTVEFLISSKSSYITGTVIYVDGGWMANA